MTQHHARPGEASARGFAAFAQQNLRLSYVASGSRDLRLDLLRGYAVFAMIVDHVGGDSPSRLYVLTGGDQFFVSAAETFVFVSGVIVGIVYGNRALALGWRQAAVGLVGRAWTLYALAVWLAIAIATLDALLGAADPALTQSPGQFILEIVATRRTYYLVDVMLLYGLLMLAAPVAVALLLHARWWLVLAASWCLWGAYELWPAHLQLPWPIVSNDVFHFAAWQVLFFNGMVLGFTRGGCAGWARSGARAFADRWPNLSGRPLVRHAGLGLLLVLFGGLVWLYQTNGSVFDVVSGPWTNQSDRLQTWFDKSSLPATRLAAFAVTFGLGWTLVTRYWRPLHAVLGPALLPLGQAALYAYAVHVFMVSGIGAVERWVGGAEPVLPGKVNMAIQLGTVGTVWALTRARFLRSVVAPLGTLPFRRVRLNDRAIVLAPTRALGGLVGIGLVGIGVFLVRG